MKKAIAIAAILFFISVKPGQAQFFGGIVYDPTNFHNAVLRYYQLRMQVAQLQQTYQQVLNQYNLAVQMAKNIQNMPARYKAYFSQWRYLTARDLYNNTGPWVNAVNFGSPGASTVAYKRATAPLLPYNPGVLSAINPHDAAAIRSRFASVELADGASANAMTTIGNIRADAHAVQRQIANLEQDSLSSNPALNSEVGVLNKVNATNILILRSLQDANNLRLSSLEQQIAQTKLKRDVATVNLDRNTLVHSNAQALSPLTTGMGQAVDNFQIP
ncbi:MAG TPA: hypothetical protein VGX94_09575 [Terriglobia bacterium]|nr:hypothetical protein [Terriglobia bacterium]